ncbi:MAG: hypothetical protein HGA31_05665 [Candidatus Moranbacteria bacterium]|nr:hypothetical protein [Candidatus Moranbacteria bacterium]
MARSLFTTYKVFPELADGDQVMVEFDTSEERDAFNGAVEELRKFLKTAEDVDTRIDGFEFSTTLRYQVATSEHDLIRQIFGFRVLNIFSRDSVVICVK